MKQAKKVMVFLVLGIALLGMIAGFVKNDAYLVFLGVALAVLAISNLVTFKGEKSDDERGELIQTKAGFYAYALVSAVIIVLLEIARRGIIDDPVTLLQIAFVSALISRPLCVLIIGKIY